MNKLLVCALFILGVSGSAGTAGAADCKGLPEGASLNRTINVITDNQTSSTRWFEIWDLHNVFDYMRYYVPPGGYQTNKYVQLQCLSLGPVTYSAGDYGWTVDEAIDFPSNIWVAVNRLESGPDKAQVGATYCLAGEFPPWSGTATLKITYTPRVMYGQFGVCTAVFTPGTTTAPSYGRNINPY